MRRAFVALLVAGALAPATGAFAVPRTADDGGIGIRLGEAPTDRRDDPRAQLYIIDHVKPGASIRRKLVVTDKSQRAVNVDVYPGGADIQGGAFTGTARGEASELTTWTRLSLASASLAAGESRTFEATITVPANASPGERYGVVWAEVASAPGSGVRQVNRVGVRIYLSVGPGGEPASDFTVDALKAGRLPDGQPAVYALVHNTGGRALDMSGSLRLTNGPGGLSAGPFPAKLGTTLAVRDTEPVTVLLDKALPPGPWLARIELTSGLTKRAAQATITFPDAPGPGTEVSAAPVVLTQESDKGGFPLVPIIGTAAGVGLIGLVALVVFKRPRKRGGSPAKHGRR